MGQRGHGGTSGYKTRVHVYPGTRTSGTTGNKRVQSGGTHVPLRHTLATGTLPFLGVSSLSCPSFSFYFLSFLILTPGLALAPSASSSVPAPTVPPAGCHNV